jgi:glycerol-3-phosphate dehydrogenase
MEPELNPSVSCSLDVPESAIVSPYELAFAMADDAAVNGVSFMFRQEILSVSAENPGWRIETAAGNTFTCKVFINCAGASGAALHNMISDVKFHIVHRRGQYYLLDRSVRLPFSRTVFQCPSSMGKGVLVSPTVHGNLLLGPNAEDIADPLDTSTTREGLSFVLERAARTWPSVSVRSNITNFSGIRAHLDTDDFSVGPVSGAPGAFEAIGIESPGLSSAPAIGADLASMVAESMSLSRKEKIIPPRKPMKPFCDMNDAERAEAVRSDPLYGNIVCRCEVVTEAEIREAIRRPVGAHSIDGIKRRTRAGMGRCQGGFCSPRVAGILSEETGLSMLEITKDGGESFLLADTIGSFLKRGAGND